MIKVLFVCLGNICRSPMAEGIFKARNNPNLHIESRATSTWEHGNPVYPGTQKILKNYEIDISLMKSEPINDKDFADFDYIIGMDKQNIKDLLNRAPKDAHSKIHLYLDVLEYRKGQDIPDPWYTGDFKETESLILEALPIWLEKLDEKRL